MFIFRKDKKKSDRFVSYWRLESDVITFFSKSASVETLLKIMPQNRQNLNNFSHYNYIWNYYYYFFWVFHTSVSWWFFTGVWVTASLFKFPGHFSVFWPISKCWSLDALHLSSEFQVFHSPVSWGCRIHWLHFCKGKKVSWMWHKTIW